MNCPSFGWKSLKIGSLLGKKLRHSQGKKLGRVKGGEQGDPGVAPCGTRVGQGPPVLGGPPPTGCLCACL